MLGKLFYGMLYTWLNTMRFIGWFRWTIEGVEKLPPRSSGGMIVAMNHVNWIDIPFIGAMLPFEYRLSWMGKAELFKRPLMAWWLRTMKVVPVNRGRRDLAALDAVIDALRQGDALLIFPEGTRGRTGILQAGRGGTVRIAMQARVPIIPVAVVGTEHGLRGSFKRRPVHVKIGDPYWIEPTSDGKIPASQMALMTDDLMVRIAALLPEERRGIYAARLTQDQAL